MAKRYSLGVRTSNTTTGNACFEVYSAKDRVRILEIGITLNAATASAFGLGRPAAVGITPTTPVALLAEDGKDATSVIYTALAWGTGPTIPAAFLRRVSLPATVGAGVVWTFPEGLYLSSTGSLILWNLSTVSAADVWVVGEE